MATATTHVSDSMYRRAGSEVLFTVMKVVLHGRGWSSGADHQFAIPFFLLIFSFFLACSVTHSRGVETGARWKDATNLQSATNANGKKVLK